MSILNRNKDFYNTPFRLTKKQKKNPLEVIKYFFSGIHLHESREAIAELIHVALITDNFYFDEPRKRSDAIFFGRQLEEVLEAAYLLQSQKKKTIKKKK